MTNLPISDVFWQITGSMLAAATSWLFLKYFNCKRNHQDEEAFKTLAKLKENNKILTQRTSMLEVKHKGIEQSCDGQEWRLSKLASLDNYQMFKKAELQAEVKKVKQREKELVRQLESVKAKLEDEKREALQRNKQLKGTNRTLRRRINKLQDTLKKLETEVEEGQKHLFKQANEEGNNNDDQAESTGACSVCWINELDTMISPCNHVCLCKSCATKVEEECPICKGPIEERITVFVS